MKQLTTSLKLMFADRSIAVLAALIVFATIGYVIYIALSLNPTDIQIATRYTAFGEVHYYRNKWFYLLSFAAFGVIIAVAHLALVGKLLHQELRTFAVAVAWMTLLMLGIALAFAHSVLSIAFLS